MKEIKLFSYAKINLFLDIIGKRQDGYHNIKSVMQEINLKDEITIKDNENNKDIIINCNNKDIPLDHTNTAYKAVILIKHKYKINKGAIIYINKNIPIESGMAGGSSNAASVIKGLNKLWDLMMTEDEMLELGLKIGADVPFCLTGGTALVEGIGEKITKLKPFKWENILIVKPEFNMSTALVYNKMQNKYFNLYNGNKIVEYINSGSYKKAALNIANTLEYVVEEIHPEINDIKNKMIELNACSSIMTGSGSVVFGLFRNKEDLVNAEKKLSKKYSSIYKAETI